MKSGWEVHRLEGAPVSQDDQTQFLEYHWFDMLSICIYTLIHCAHEMNQVRTKCEERKSPDSKVKKRGHRAG